MRKVAGAEEKKQSFFTHVFFSLATIYFSRRALPAPTDRRVIRIGTQQQRRRNIKLCPRTHYYTTAATATSAAAAVAAAAAAV